MKNLRLAALAALLMLPAAAIAQVPDSLNPYVRKPRTAAVSLELGANSLSSLIGLKGTFFVTPQWAVDAGLGLSNTALRPGLYARYLFTPAKFTPFAYGGFKYGIGTGGRYVETKDPDTNEEIGLKVEPSPFLDAGLGIDYLAHNGFYFTGGLGWSQLLRGKNYALAGDASEDARNAFKFIMGSGIALFLSLGYAF